MPVPEYRRFIAYFYEYIDGKKQGNAGFAKVELRNGMWRILFRLTSDIMPEPPLQIYGFVRQKGYLLGVLMGTIRSGKEFVEEWAYQAETPIGGSAYRLEDFSGIRVSDSDGRCFMTVWDDEAVQPERFVLRLPETSEREADAEAGDMEDAGDGRRDAADEPAEDGRRNPAGEAGNMEDAEEDAGDIADRNTEYEAVFAMEEHAEGEAHAEGKEHTEGEEHAEGEAHAEAEEEKREAAQHGCAQEDCDVMRELFQTRSHFQPFADGEIHNCIMIMPCDVIRLQQEGWQVGRSSFLQHGFYQYRHLLLGTLAGGAYVIGVPGLKNPQEQYMAGMFGFDRFKLSKKYECGKIFGYWYRTLEKR